jgi:hypothetical protein
MAWDGVGGLCGCVAGLIFAKIVQAALERWLCIHLHVQNFEVVLRSPLAGVEPIE